MLGNPVLDVAFVVTITAFFKKQFALEGKWALLVAFIVTLFIAVVPQIALLFPPIAPWLTIVVSVIVLFLAAAGSYDLISDFRTKSVPPDPGL